MGISESTYQITSWRTNPFDYRLCLAGENNQNKPLSSIQNSLVHIDLLEYQNLQEEARSHRPFSIPGKPKARSTVGTFHTTGWTKNFFVNNLYFFFHQRDFTQKFQKKKSHR
jgi:hypothetical protein